MSKERAQVTLRDIHGPYVQLLTNLQGEDGRDWLEALKRFLRKEDFVWMQDRLHQENSVPVFEQNEHGHYMIEFEGLGLTGIDEYARLSFAGFEIEREALLCLTNPADSETTYDAYHRLTAGQRYRIVLMPNKVLKRKRSRDDLIHAAKSFGYDQPLAGIAPRLCEALTPRQIRQMGFGYIAVIHHPIPDVLGNPYFLKVSGSSGGMRFLGAHRHRVSEVYLNGAGATAWLVDI